MGKPRGVFLALFTISLFFFSLFVFKSIEIMKSVQFYEFDEAHRAETAKRMKEYGSYLVPIAGSYYDRVDRLNMSATNQGKFLRLYYHLERPPFVYLLMIGSISIFGEQELAFRLPSFVLGISVFAIFFYFVRAHKAKINWYAFFAGFLVLLTSSDLWLSSQYAQLDTGLTAFLFLGLVLLIIYAEKRKNILIYASGISFALAVLSKGQPAAIFLFPLIFLFFAGKISLRDVLKFLLGSAVLIAPWIFYMSTKFGLITFIQTFFGFALSSATIEDSHQTAPIFWYIRWWWESFRPGWSLFLALVALDVFRKQLTWQKGALLSYVFGSLLFLSLPYNKIWWYTLPLIPAVALYVYISLNDYLKKSGILSITMVLFFASFPIFLQAQSKPALIYGLLVVSSSIFILSSPILNLLKRDTIFLRIFFMASIIFALYSFYLRFPKIVPYYWETKSVGQFYTTLPEPKCLWASGIPVETTLFYSNAVEVYIFNSDSILPTHCKNYIIINEENNPLNTLLRDKSVLYQNGKLKLIAL